ncbi:MAG TPA: hypothetical protein EYO84_05325, partial [Planctomycetes bacterium]|nr:hypothetical protein [Planctomycetota bacterium]
MKNGPRLNWKRLPAANVKAKAKTRSTSSRDSCGWRRSGLKKTVLNSAHQRHGARLVEFGGFEMPVWYSSL